jgi:hypothetical protein
VERDGNSLTDQAQRPSASWSKGHALSAASRFESMTVEPAVHAAATATPLQMTNAMSSRVLSTVGVVSTRRLC